MCARDLCQSCADHNIFARWCLRPGPLSHQYCLFFMCIEGSYASERVFVQQISSRNSNYYACRSTSAGDRPRQPDVPAAARPLRTRPRRACTHERRVHYKSCSCDGNEMEISISEQKVSVTLRPLAPTIHL